MTLIPRQEEKNCFIACSADKVKQGHCDCVNRVRNQALNIPDVVGQSEQLSCDHKWVKPIINAENRKCYKCGIWEEKAT